MGFASFCQVGRQNLTKTLLVMKLTITLLLAFSIQVSARVYAQERVTLSEKNATLESVLQEISRQTGYDYAFQDKWKKVSNRVNITVSNSSLKEALDICFKTQPFSYDIIDKIIVIKEKKVDSVSAADGDVHGRVTDSLGNPLSGASVQIKNSKRGTETDRDGNYVINQVDAGATMVISYTGYVNKEIKLNGNNTVSVMLSISHNPLDAIQIIAYGVTTKRLNTGDVTTVESADIEKQPVANPLAALEGRVAGLQIVQSSGVSGSSFKVQIRGQNSIAQGSDPFFIVDGVPFVAGNNIIGQVPSATNNPLQQSQGGLSPFNSLNPSDIESIEVLKDADATAIYGSRGANGVILIRTKKGKIGKTKLNLNVYSGTSVVTRTMNMLNTPQYLSMRHEAFNNDGMVADQNSAPDLLVWDTTRYTDFKKMLIGGTARTTDGQLSVTGGDKSTQFLIGGGFHRETTVFPGDMSDTRGSLHLSVNHTSENNRLNIALFANYSSDKNNLPSTDLTASINLAPNFPALRDSSGNLNWDYKGVPFQSNPLAYLLQKYSVQTDNLISNIQISYKIFEGLSFRVSLGYNSVTASEIQINPISSQNPLYSPQGYSQFGNTALKSWVIEPQLEFNQRIGIGKLNILAGTTSQQNTNSNNYLYGYGFTNDALLQSIAGASYLSATNAYTQYRYDAIFGRINYNIKNKYIVNVTGRRDGSSRFGPGKQYSNFGSVGGAWIFSNEDYFKNKLPFISFGKLRGSYGITGNDQIGDYQYLESWTSTRYAYQGNAGLHPNRLFNPDYSWEINRKLEGALELGFLQERILVSTAYYRNRSSNQLIHYPLPNQTGFPNVTENLPALVQNTGWEISIATKNIVTKDFTWSSSVNFTVPRNKLVSFPGLVSSTYNNKYVVGQSLNVLNKFQFLGVDQQTGVFKFNDLNHDGVFDAKDFSVLGNTDPKFYGGFQNSFNYKGFQLDVFMEFKKQIGKNYLALQDNFGPPGFAYNQPEIILNRWQKPGDISNVQKFTQTYEDVHTAAVIYLPSSNGIYSDASYIRLKTVSFSYSLSPKTDKALHVQSCLVYLRAQNLFTITSYVGSDPENQNLFTLPPLRTITGGIQLNF